MDDDCPDFFDEMTSCRRPDFKTRFARTLRRLGLNAGLTREELSRLYEAAFLGALCNISFNGLGGCGGEIRAEKEPTRRRLEQAFMDARQNFYRCSGWKTLTAERRKSIESVFLTVEVGDENLAD